MRVGDPEIVVEALIGREESAADAVAEMPLPDVGGPIAVSVAKYRSLQIGVLAFFPPY